MGNLARKGAAMQLLQVFSVVLVLAGVVLVLFVFNFGGKAVERVQGVAGTAVPNVTVFANATSAEPVNVSNATVSVEPSVSPTPTVTPSPEPSSTPVPSVFSSNFSSWPMFRYDSFRKGGFSKIVPKYGWVQEWVFEAGSLVFSSIAVANGRVVFGSDSNKVFALKEDSGDVLWEFDAGAWVRSSPAIENGSVFFWNT
ncbi:MAG: PQQ-binding-like beta-propeller repeat protein, partial [Candidatus Micrarchaeia archaeon]